MCTSEKVYLFGFSFPEHVKVLKSLQFLLYSIHCRIPNAIQSALNLCRTVLSHDLQKKERKVKQMFLRSITNAFGHLVFYKVTE